MDVIWSSYEHDLDGEIYKVNGLALNLVDCVNIQ